MTQEEKAKAYDVALERAKAFNKRWQCVQAIDSELALKELKEIFPELMESEDERIKKALIRFHKSTIDIDGIKGNEIVDWIEKQGGQTDKIVERAKTERQRVLITESNGEANIDWDSRSLQDVKLLLGYGLDYVNKLEKQGEQKSVDKVEPKFKVGDWCIDNEDGTIFQIVKVLDNTYIYKTNEGKEYSCTHYSLENDARLWTIQDAKDGDVLVTCFEEDNIIIMYHSRCTIDTINVHCCLDNKFVCENLGVFDAEDVKPATKEQRDLLFQKMHEAGYEWDAEEKELKKIVDEEYNGEDYGIDSLWHAKNILEETLGSVDGYQTDDGILSHQRAITAVKKLYEQKPDWSEEDERMRKDIIRVFKGEISFTSEKENEKYTAWLKSLKQRYTWKPSEEQMDALNSARWNAPFKIEILDSLYNDLKKLTE